MDKLLLRVISLLILCIICVLKINCQCDAGGIRRFDSTAARLLTIGNSGRKFPENKQDQLKKFCDQSDTFIKELEVYKSKCMKDLPKQVSGVIIFTVKTQMNQLCKKDSKRLTDLIDGGQCFNKGMNGLNKCYTKFIDSLLGAQSSPDDKKIPHLCCQYTKIFPCFESQMKRVKGCTNENYETFADFVRSLCGNAVDLICGDWTEGSDKCEKLESPPKKKKHQRRSKSFWIPMIELLSSFSEIE